MKVALLLALVAACTALPTGFSKQYVGNIDNIGNLMDVEFLPNGFALLAGRDGKILIANLYANNLPQKTYMDLTSVTFNNGCSLSLGGSPAGETGLMDIALDPNFSTNGA